MPLIKTKSFLLPASLFLLLALPQPLVRAAAPAAAPAPHGMAASHGDAEKVVVAKVNGQVINMAQLMRKMSEISRTEHGSEAISPLLAQEIKKEATDKLITEELAYQKAKAVIKGVPPERLKDKIAQVKKRFKDEADFQHFVKNQFGGEKEFENQMQRFETIQMFIEQEFDAKIKVSDQEIKKAYEAEKHQLFVTDELVQINDLVFFSDPKAADSVAKAKQVRQGIIDKFGNDPGKLPEDNSFALQKSVTLNQTKSRALFEAARVLKPYKWSEPVEMDGNLHIVQLVGYRPAVNKSLAEATPFLENQLKQGKRQAMINQWMAGLRQGADIKIMDLTQ
ncbi:MAG: peptidyl-prolyl cis-trans isomerase [Desulfobacteraceae bacterium]|nr:peptidyl-prolyl cis-trans isomerase [Desulfobacteraceae bacterium]